MVTPGNHVFSPGRPAPGPSPQIVPIPTASAPAGPVPLQAPSHIQSIDPPPQTARPSPTPKAQSTAHLPPAAPPTLDVMGISKRESSEAQLLAEVPDERFAQAAAGITSRGGRGVDWCRLRRTRARVQTARRVLGPVNEDWSASEQDRGLELLPEIQGASRGRAVRQVGYRELKILSFARWTILSAANAVERMEGAMSTTEASAQQRLKKHLKRLSDEMVENYREALHAGTPEAVAEYREVHVREIIGRFFPRTYQTAKGAIYDSFGARSASIDCVVSAPNHPLLMDSLGRITTLLVDGVQCAVEVKPDLRDMPADFGASRKQMPEIVRGLEQVRSVKRLKRSPRATLKMGYDSTEMQDL